MGYYKNRLMEFEERGYGESDKYVCSGCIRDGYLVKKIQTHGQNGKCSFCKDAQGRPNRSRKVYSLESLMKYIMPAIRYYYMSADGNLPYDNKTGQYLGDTIDTYDFVHYVLSDELKADNSELIDEIFNLLNLEELTSIYEFRTRTSDKDLRAWNRYCSLVNNRPDFSSEQIVSLCTAPDAPEDLKEISAVIETVLNHISSIKAYSVINTGTPIYRCVNYIDLGYMPKGFSYLPASFVGTAPAKFAGSGRFNEAHDMMFYGASNPRIAAVEVGERNGFPYTIGTFYANKRIRILNLCNIWDWMCPSIFEPESEELRESWFFLRQFIKLIIEPSDGLSDEEKEKLYRPTQVMTKYLQRQGGLYGIEYRSSKSIRNKPYGTVIDKCYVLFAENKDCLDEFERTRKMDKSKLQLFMSKCEQFITLP